MRLSSSSFLFVVVVFSTELWSVKADSESKIWALLVAGSNTWDNYRHQADVCHAYQILHKNGVPDERIVVMMYDDIANNPANPTKGIIINHPNGSDVYHGVPKDYTGDDVTPQNFFSVLRGDKSAVKDIGSGKVIDSSPEDHVFVYFADHGGAGLIGFPNDYLYAKDLVETLVDMNKNKRFAKLVFYLEACESGSMFSGLLPENINVFATTASSTDESSYGCYFDDLRETALGDVYSVKWMEDSDAEDLSNETLQKQYTIVKSETLESTVHEYGNLTIATAFTVSQFQGLKGAAAERLPRAPLDAVDARDIPIAILRRRIQKTSDVDARSVLQRELDHMLRNRVFLKSKVTQIAKSLGHVGALHRKLPLKDHKCYRQAVDKFHSICFNLLSNPYSLGFLRTFVNLCESGVEVRDILSTMDSVCTHQKIDGIA